MPPKTEPKLTAPENIATGETITVTGTDFEGDTVTLDDSHMNPANNDVPIVDGGFVHDMGYTYTGPGPAAVYAKQADKKGELVEVARVTVTVVSTSGDLPTPDDTP